MFPCTAFRDQNMVVRDQARNENTSKDVQKWGFIYPKLQDYYKNPNWRSTRYNRTQKKVTKKKSVKPNPVAHDMAF